MCVGNLKRRFTLLQDVVLIAYLGEPLKCQLKCHSCAKLALHYSSNNSKGFVWCTILMLGNFKGITSQYLIETPDFLTLFIRQFFF